MRKVILFFVTSTFFMTTPVDSIEKDFELSNEGQFQLTSPIYSDYYDRIPVNPNVYETLKTFKDINLTETAGNLQPNQKIVISDFKVNDQLQPVFVLENGTFILASAATIFEDKIQSSYLTKDTFWLEKNAMVMTSPIGNEAKKVSKTPAAFSQVTVTEFVTTPRGDFAKIAEGWVSTEYLSAEDNRMEKVQEILSQKYNQADYGIYVQQLETGITAGVNEDKVMYSASTAKLPILYMVQLQLNDGTIKLSDKLKYTEAVHQFDGAYKPEGAGSMPKKADDKEYTIGELIQLTAKKSDNVASNILSYYLTKEFNDTYYRTLDAVTKTRWEMTTRDATAKQAGLVMAALYNLNPNGEVLEALSNTDFDKERIAKNIDVKIAHKVGDAYDFRHDVAIVYTDSPYMIAIFTNNKSYNDITNISDDVYAVLK
ncbi:serine hydrolase [Streptococcus merionis]|uniref:Beta-lactamase class A n=1 Tax=Streptococcus merionis TaxID=400065 RepID=A0A239SYL4_9STRE|nr:serine hydrolase [Streptococcus merionis]SNU90426.1 beta-lactamase class A [Streptococcus merionis]